MRWLLSLSLIACAPTERAAITLDAVVAGGVTEVSHAQGRVRLSTYRLPIAHPHLHAAPSVVARWVRASTASAHPGHDDAGGAVIGEVLGRWDVDLTGPDAALDRGAGWAGEVQDAAIDLDGEVRVAGDIDGTPIDLTLALRASLFAIEAEGSLSGTHTLWIAHDPAEALAFVDLIDRDGDGVITLADGAEAGLRMGLTDAAAWRMWVD